MKNKFGLDSPDKIVGGGHMSKNPSVVAFSVFWTLGSVLLTQTIKTA